MRRRAFIAALGSAAAWPLVARGQQRERLVCILETVSVDTPSAHLRYPAFLEGLQQLGWTPGRNVRVEVRWGEGDEAATRKHAAELVALTPDVIVAGGGVATEVLLKVAHNIPIVFVIVPDPVGSGFVESLSQPGANVTGFMIFEYNLCGKWLERQIKRAQLSLRPKFCPAKHGGLGGMGWNGRTHTNLASRDEFHRTFAAMITRQ